MNEENENHGESAQAFHRQIPVRVIYVANFVNACQHLAQRNGSAGGCRFFLR
jgi:hypothetical protein